jgi:hypothetical protein
MGGTSKFWREVKGEKLKTTFGNIRQGMPADISSSVSRCVCGYPILPPHRKQGGCAPRNAGFSYDGPAEAAPLPTLGACLP